MDREVARILSELHRQGVTPRGLAADSRAIARGDVFFAYPGERTDGRRFVADAVARGAAAVVWERDGFAWPDDIALPNLSANGLKALAGPLAAEVYGRPSARLWVVGVTGTNGKTSCSQWIAQALAGEGRKSAVVGTLGLGYPGELEENPNTTPDAVALQRALARFVGDGAQAVAMEASSIGLDQGASKACSSRARSSPTSRATTSTTTATWSATRRRRCGSSARRGSRTRCSTSTTRSACASRRTAREPASHGPDTRCGRAPAWRAASSTGWKRTTSSSRAPARSSRCVTSRGRAEVATALVGRFNVANVLGVIGVLLAAGLALDAAVRRPSGSSRRPAGCSGSAATTGRSSSSTTPTARTRSTSVSARCATLRAGRADG